MEKSPDLLTSSDAAKILGVSKQRVRQFVNDKRLPPSYTYGREGRFLLFDRRVVEKFAEFRDQVKWKQPEESPYLNAHDLTEYLGCPKTWVYDAVRRGKLKPVYGRLYDKGNAKKVFEKRGKKKGSSKKQELIQKFSPLYKRGLNDCKIAEKLGKKQPQIARLRKELGLPPVCGRGRPK